VVESLAIGTGTGTAIANSRLLEFKDFTRLFSIGTSASSPILRTSKASLRILLVPFNLESAQITQNDSIKRNIRTGPPSPSMEERIFCCEARTHFDECEAFSKRIEREDRCYLISLGISLELCFINLARGLHSLAHRFNNREREREQLELW
jgi:hypothetical protein